MKDLTAIDLPDPTQIEIRVLILIEGEETKTYNMSKSTISTFIFFIFLSISAQNEVDALRYSLFDNYSTARVSSLGGSFSALGGNTGSIISNPATLATYRTNEFSISLMSSNDNTQSNYLDNKNSVDRRKLHFQNIGYIQTINLENTEGWNRFNYALTYNRRTDLNRKLSIGGYNEQSTMANTFLNNAQGTPWEDLNSSSDYLAYYTYLIDTIDTNTWYSNVNQIGQNQYAEISESGSIDDFDISASSAYKDFLFLGASMTMSSINYTFQSRYLENGFNTENEIQAWNFNENLYVTGFGLNFKIGAIVKPWHFLRLGWAYHSKTYYELEESYETNMSTITLNLGDHYQDNLHITDPYRIQTPAKAIGSLALVFAKRGLITFDFEAIDYTSANLSSIYHAGFQTANNNVANFYQKTNNKKLGIEWRAQGISFRTGYAIFGNPFNSELNNGEKEYLSSGIGFQKGAYFFDIALINCLTEGNYILYNDPTLLNPTQSAEITQSKKSIIISCNYKF
jgi:hypothetical protein